MKRALRILGYVVGGLVLLAALGFALLFWWISNPATDPQKLPPALLSIDSSEGAALLESAAAKADHTPLHAAFQPQQKGSWCGVASSVIALRALDLAPKLTQEGFFTDRASAVRSELAVTFGGMNLDELGALLEVHGAKATVVHAADSDVDRFRAAATANLARSGDVVLVNYKRAKLNQGSPGHISPIAAHDATSDRMLVLDTAAYKWPATWVKTADLFAAMNTHDPASGKTRGFVEVQRP
jgi:hypothetical protein